MIICDDISEHYIILIMCFRDGIAIVGAILSAADMVEDWTWPDVIEEIYSLLLIIWF